MENIGYFNKNDVAQYMDESQKKTNIISQDAINSEIIQFCSNLFLCWLEDYEIYVEKAKIKNKTYSQKHLNDGLKKNLED